MNLQGVDLLDTQGLVDISSLGLSGEGWETGWWGGECVPVSPFFV